jgi:ankyrin repeat protein
MEAADHNYVRKIRVLTTSNDLRINRRDHQGRTALMIAADDASPQCIKALLDAHADFKLRDKSGRTALQLAEAGLSNAREGYKIEGYRETIQHLRDAGAND